MEDPLGIAANRDGAFDDGRVVAIDQSAFFFLDEDAVFVLEHLPVIDTRVLEHVQDSAEKTSARVPPRKNTGTAE